MGPGRCISGLLIAKAQCTSQCISSYVECWRPLTSLYHYQSIKTSCSWSLCHFLVQVLQHAEVFLTLSGRKHQPHALGPDHIHDHSHGAASVREAPSMICLPPNESVICSECVHFNLLPMSALLQNDSSVSASLWRPMSALTPPHLPPLWRSAMETHVVHLHDLTDLNVFYRIGSNFNRTLSERNTSSGCNISQMQAKVCCLSLEAGSDRSPAT